MPRRSTLRRRTGGRYTKSMRGKGFMDFVKKVGRFVKKHKLISRVAGGLSSLGVPIAGSVSRAAGAVGLGRKTRRRRRGAGLRLAS